MEKNNKNILIKYFTTDNTSGYKTKEKHVELKFDGLLEEINNYNKICGFEENIEFSQKLYNFLYNIKEIPKCETCGKEIIWKGRFSEGYRKNCSKNCRSKSKTRIEKIKTTNIERYGIDSVSKVDKFKEKRRKTYFNKFGNENIFQSEIVKEKTKKTNLKKYGYEFSSKSEIVKNKTVETNLNKFGVEYPSKLKEHNKTSILNNRKYIEEKFKERGYIILDYLENNNICVKHPDGHTFIENRAILNNRFNANIELSTKLLPLGGFRSSYELKIKEFLNKNNIDYISGNKKILSGLEIDIYFPDHNLGIEFNGLYWHSEINKTSDYHLNKTVECEKKGIQLIHIFEDEWNLKEKIVESIIKSKLGLIDNKIYARKCEIKEIFDNSLVKDFLNKNHIQGFIGSQIKIGLFYENELVSLMTFGKKRKIMNSVSKDGEYEMLRFCNKIDTTVIGGASKLFNYFVNNYKPKNIVTYADRRYSNGGLYYKLGMKFIKNTEPNYWYFKRNGKQIREHRFKHRKDVLVKQGFDLHKTEKQIMTERDYLRIYDCGNMKFEYVV